MHARAAHLGIVLGAAVAASAADLTVLCTAGVESPLGWPYSTFAEGSVDRSGRVVFAASSTALFRRTPKGLVAQLGAGTVMPDGRRISGVGPPARVSATCVVTQVTYQAGGDSIVRACNSVFSVVIDGGAPAPGGGIMSAFDSAVFVAGDQIIAGGAIVEGGTSLIFRHDAEGLVEVARTGMPSPKGGTFTSLRLLGVTTTGMVSFRATVSDGPDGIFAGDGSAIRGIALVGQPSPKGGTFAGIGGGAQHAAGPLVFRGELSSGQSGVFATDTTMPVATLRTAALQGDSVPVADARIRGFASSISPSINASGIVAFRALLDGGSSVPPAGVFVASATGSLAVMALARDTIPGGGALSRFRDPLVADDGSVLVSAVVGGEGPALFVGRSGAPLAPLARLGDPTDADTGDSKFRFSAASVTVASEDAVMLGQRDAIFRRDGDGTTKSIAYAGQPTSAGGVMALLGPPAVDGQGVVVFGVELQGAQFNEALFAGEGGLPSVFMLPTKRILGGRGIRELFPTSVDSLARPVGVVRGVALTAALRGARAAEAIVVVKRPERVRVVARTGMRVSRDRIASLGTPSLVGGRIGFLADLGRKQHRLGVVEGAPGALSVVAKVGTRTGSRIGGTFGELGPPSTGPHGSAFRVTLAGESKDGVFLGHRSRAGLLAGTGDVTVRGGHLRTVEDPVVAGDSVWFLARVSGSVDPAGLYRVVATSVPQPDAAPLLIEDVLLPGDPAPASIGGTIVRVTAPRVGPGGVVSVVAAISGGTTASAILAITPTPLP